MTSITFNYTNKKVFITGGTGGIGQTITKKFLETNAKVFITSTSQEKINQFIEKLQQENINTDNLYSQILNLNNIEEIKQTINIANEKMNGIDILICNAGITKDNLAIRMSESEWNDVININLNANFILNKEAIKIMMKQKFGRIINITSIVGLTGNIGQVNYSASKAGLIGMTKTLASEYAKKNITINCIAPGFIETEMTNKISEDYKQKLLNNIPLNKYGTTEDIANGILFLASNEASYITGETLNINGGMLMK